MELLDRYLQAVKKHLPLRRQDDIIAELRANMESQLEDKESELGRPMTTGEQEDWLRKMGSPILVAARYQPQQYLIGPSIFPVYWYVLRMAILWALVIYSVVIAVVIPITSPNGAGVVESLLRIPGILITVAAWVTAVFATFEFVATHYPEKCSPIAGLSGAWSPSTLPPLEKTPESRRKARSFAQAVAEIVFGFLFLGWLLLIPRHPFIIMGPGIYFWRSSPFQLADVWMTFFWWMVGLNVVQLVWRCSDLLRGTWQQSARVQQIAYKVILLIPIIQLITIRDHVYVSLKHPAVNQLQYANTVRTINKSVHLGLLVVAAIIALQLAFEISQWAWDAYRKHETAR
jgi:hypothetical protein